MVKATEKDWEKHHKKDVSKEKKKGAGRETPEAPAPAAPAKAKAKKPAKAKNIKAESQIIADEIMENKETIIHCHNTIINSLKESLNNAFGIGAVLFRQKELLPTREFGKWINKNLPFTIRTAQRYMKLKEYKVVLLENNIESITDAYHFIFGEPVSDQIAEVDDGIKTEHTVTTKHPDVDNIAKPKNPAPGPAMQVRISKETINAMKNEEFPYENRKGCYSKFCVEISNHMADRDMITEWMIEAQKYLRPGGKIIFKKLDGC